MGKRKFSRNELMERTMAFRDSRVQFLLEQNGWIEASPDEALALKTFGAEDMKTIIELRQTYCVEYADRHGVPKAFVRENPNASTWYQDFWDVTMKKLCEYFTLRLDRGLKPFWFSPQMVYVEKIAPRLPFKRSPRVAASLLPRVLRGIAKDNGWNSSATY